MSEEVRKLLPKRVLEVEIYDPKRSEIEYDLSDNTSQWGIAPQVKKVLRESIDSKDVTLSRYPDIYGAELKKVISEKYSTYLDSNTNNVIVGNGTDDILDCIIIPVTDEGDLIVVPTPTFPMVGYFSKVNGRRVRSSELSSEGSINVEEISSYKPDLIYLCSPNNPTGVSIPLSDIQRLIDSTSCFIVIDEAYAEFSEQNCLELLRRSPRVIITRTMSKLHSLAGLRIGYGLGNSDVISAIEALRGPYKANTLGLKAAIASFEEYAYHDDVVQQVQNVRDWFSMELRFIGFSVEDSDANFVYVTGLDEEKLKRKFSSAGYNVRWFKNLDVVGSGARITMAPKNVLQPLLEIIKDNI